MNTYTYTHYDDLVAIHNPEPDLVQILRDIFTSLFRAVNPLRRIK